MQPAVPVLSRTEVSSPSLKSYRFSSPGRPGFLLFIHLRRTRAQAAHNPGGTRNDLLHFGGQGPTNLHPATNSSSTSLSRSSALAFGLLTSFSTLSSPCSWGESTLFKELAPGCRTSGQNITRTPLPQAACALLRSWGSRECCRSALRCQGLSGARDNLNAGPFNASFSRL